MKVQLLHGHDKYDIIFELSENMSLEDFAMKIETVTGVPVINQRLIFKGKSLTNMAEKIATIGLQDKCKVMMIGKKFNEEEEGYLKTMKGIEDKVNNTDKKLQEVHVQVSDIQKGFLAVNLQPEALGRLNHKVEVCIEEFTSQLEQLDSIILSSSTLEIQNRRKSIVRRIQTLLQQADDLQASITDSKVASR